MEPLRASIPEAIKRVIDDEMGKLSGLEQASSEFNVTRNYLDWLTQLPWGKHSDERLDIAHAQQVCLDDFTPWLCLMLGSIDWSVRPELRLCDHCCTCPLFTATAGVHTH